MWGPIAFLGLVALGVTVVWLFTIVPGSKAAAKGDRQAAHAQQDRRNKPAAPHPTNGELADMITSAQSDMQRDKQLREQVELEQHMGGEL